MGRKCFEFVGSVSSRSHFFMGELTMSRKCFKFVSVVLAAAIFATIAGVGRADTVLLQDTFNNASDSAVYGVAGGYGVLQELNQSYRQTGTYANTIYTYYGGRVNTGAQVNASSITGSDGSSTGAGRLCLNGSAWVSPNHNFNGADAVGGLRVSFDLLGVGTATTNGTPEINVGANTQGAAGALANPGLSLCFIQHYTGYPIDGHLHYYVNAGAEQDAVYTTSPYVWHNISLLFTDTVDGKPFNGTGNVHVQGFLDGSSTPFVNVSLGTDFANNYISVGANGGTGYNLFDNLTISQVPEPTALIMLVTGLIGLLAYAWRKRR